MTSDGMRFRVAILRADQNTAKIVMGTNEASYPEGDKQSPKRNVDKDKKAVFKHKGRSAFFPILRLNILLKASDQSY